MREFNHYMIVEDGGRIGVYRWNTDEKVAEFRTYSKARDFIVKHANRHGDN